jgi:hypothetical protein
VAPADEVCRLIRSVRRWKRADELRTEWARIVTRLTAELDSVEAELRDLAARKLAGSPRVILVDPAHDQTGLVVPDDEFLRRAEALLTRRQALRRRLDRLDSVGDPGRAVLVQDVINQAGGAAAVAAAIAPGRPAPQASEAARVRSAVAVLAGALGALDPESSQARELSERHDALGERLAAHEAAAAGHRLASARSLIADATRGRLTALAELESALRPIDPELAVAVGALRASDRELVATVAELLAEEP